MRIQLAVLAVVCVVLAIGAVSVWTLALRRATRWCSRRRTAEAEVSRGHRFQKPKPAWVRAEVLRLKAWHPQLGCRKIADTFNLLHRKRRESVSKSFVALALKGREEEILRLRRRLRLRRPRPLPRNLVWGMDLTFAPGESAPRAVLGVVDHGSRFCLALSEMRTRTSVAVLRVLLDLVEKGGRPKAVRTDNEALFTSRVFRFGLFVLGIRHQRSAPFCPWQNGRIERLFGTLKASWRPWLRESDPSAELKEDLATFRAWYNFARPHQHLDGRTPAMAWNGTKLEKVPRARPRYVSAWNGRLTGYLYPT